MNSNVTQFNVVGKKISTLFSTITKYIEKPHANPKTFHDKNLLDKLISEEI